MLAQWSLDVATIGNVYRGKQKTVYCFSGLGWPFIITNLNEERNWLLRAWTLQEVRGLDVAIVGGRDPTRLPSFLAGENNIASFEKLTRELMKTIANGSSSIFSLLKAMRPRFAVHAMDKVAGLAYLMCDGRLPAYSTTEGVEEAWQIIIGAAKSQYLLDAPVSLSRPGTSPSPLVSFMGPDRERVSL